MRTRLAVMALIIGVTALSGVSDAETYVVAAPGLLGDYGGNLTDLNQDGSINVGDVQLFVATRVSKQSEIRTRLVAFDHIDQVRLRLVGTAVDDSGGLAPYFSVDNGATICAPVNGAFDQTTVISGHSTTLLDRLDTITATLNDDGQGGYDIHGNAWMTYASCTITDAFVEIDGVVAFWYDDPNGDGYVNVGDLQCLVAAWGSMLHDPAYDSQPSPKPSPNWNATCDLNRDGFVNVGDLQGLMLFWPR